MRSAPSAYLLFHPFVRCVCGTGLPKLQRSNRHDSSVGQAERAILALTIVNEVRMPQGLRSTFSPTVRDYSRASRFTLLVCVVVVSGCAMLNKKEQGAIVGAGVGGGVGAVIGNQ